MYECASAQAIARTYVKHLRTRRKRSATNLTKKQKQHMTKFIKTSLVAMLALTIMACADMIDTTNDSNVEVVFTAQLDDCSVQADGTRAFADGLTATALTYVVYKSGTTDIVQSGTGTFSNRKASVSLTLMKSIAYDIVFWADSGEGYYTFDTETQIVKANYTSGMTANDESRDAFYKTLNEYTASSSTSETITLTRATAQINIGTNDLQDTDMLSDYSNATYKFMLPFGLPLSINLVSGEVVYTTGLAYTFSSKGLVTDQSDYASEVYPVSSDYDYVMMAYVLAPPTKTNYTTQFSIHTADFDGLNLIHLNLEELPLQQNYRTNIYGQLYTSDKNFTVEIDPMFGDHDYNDGYRVAYALMTAEAGSTVQQISDCIITADDIQLAYETILAESGTAEAKTRAYTEVLDYILIQNRITWDLNGFTVTIEASGNESYSDYYAENLSPSLVANELIEIENGTLITDNAIVFSAQGYNYLTNMTLRTENLSDKEIDIYGVVISGSVKRTWNDTSCRLVVENCTLECTNGNYGEATTIYNLVDYGYLYIRSSEVLATNPNKAKPTRCLYSVGKRFHSYIGYTTSLTTALSESQSKCTFTSTSNWDTAYAIQASSDAYVKARYLTANAIAGSSSISYISPAYGVYATDEAQLVFTDCSFNAEAPYRSNAYSVCNECSEASSVDQVNFTNCTFSASTGTQAAINYYSRGNRASASLSNCTMTATTKSGASYGVYMYGNDILEMDDCTITTTKSSTSNSSLAINRRSAAVMNYGSGEITISNSELKSYNTDYHASAVVNYFNGNIVCDGCTLNATINDSNNTEGIAAVAMQGTGGSGQMLFVNVCLLNVNNVSSTETYHFYFANLADEDDSPIGVTPSSTYFAEDKYTIYQRAFIGYSTSYCKFNTSNVLYVNNTTETESGVYNKVFTGQTITKVPTTLTAKTRTSDGESEDATLTSLSKLTYDGYPTTTSMYHSYHSYDVSYNSKYFDNDDGYIYDINIAEWNTYKYRLNTMTELSTTASDTWTDITIYEQTWPAVTYDTNTDYVTN